MFESTGGDFGQWLTNLFGGSGSTGSAQNYTDIASAMNPALVGQANIANAMPGQALNAASSISPNWQSAMNSAGGGMNWAGLSQGLGKLSEQLGKGSSGSDQLQKSDSVASTVSGGVLAPKEAGRGAEALASMLANRNQLGQYLLLSAMQGKGRGKSGGGLLG